MEKLLNYFEKCGYSIEFGRNTCKGAAFIVNDYIRSWHHPQENWFFLKAVDGQTAEYEINGTDRTEIHCETEKRIFSRLERLSAAGKGIPQY